MLILEIHLLFWVLFKFGRSKFGVKRFVQWIWKYYYLSILLARDGHNADVERLKINFNKSINRQSLYVKSLETWMLFLSAYFKDFKCYKSRAR